MKKDRELDISDVLGGTLNVLGLKIDLAKLLSSPEDMGDRLQELRERLRQAGGKEVLGYEEWRSGASVSGHFRTRGILGDAEYHIGTTTLPKAQKGAKGSPQPLEFAEPAVDVFDEADGIMVVVEVPGLGLEDLELKVEDEALSLSTKPTTHRNYRKKIKLGSPVAAESLQATCRNGIPEVHLQKKMP